MPRNRWCRNYEVHVVGQRKHPPRFPCPYGAVPTNPFRGEVRISAPSFSPRTEEERRRRRKLLMTIGKMTRSFRYAGLLLPDPAPDLDVEGVRNLYAASYFLAQNSRTNLSVFIGAGARLVQSRTINDGRASLFVRPRRVIASPSPLQTDSARVHFSESSVGGFGFEGDSLKSPKHFFKKCLDWTPSVMYHLYR
jgi:ubiquitin